MILQVHSSSTRMTHSEIGQSLVRVPFIVWRPWLANFDFLEFSPSSYVHQTFKLIVFSTLRRYSFRSRVNEWDISGIEVMPSFLYMFGKGSNSIYNFYRCNWVNICTLVDFLKWWIYSVVGIECLLRYYSRFIWPCVLWNNHHPAASAEFPLPSLSVPHERPWLTYKVRN